MSESTNFKFPFENQTYDFDDVFVRKEYFVEGGLWLWGKQNNGISSFGQLGNNSSVSVSSPIQTISGGINWRQIGLGAKHSAAIKTDGTLWLWGANDSGVLGTNSTVWRSSPVQTISCGTNWKQVNLGNYTSAAIKTDGTLWLWGYNCGKLGNNSTISRSSPVQTISCGANWKQVSVGFDASSAIKTDGTLWLWGRNFFGVLGINSDIDQSSPVQTISCGINWKQVSLGTFHSAAIKTDGTLWLWGGDSKGILGNNSTIGQFSPVQTISCGTDWKQVSLGYCHSAAIKTNGTLWLWGDNTYALLGTGYNGAYCGASSPVQTISQGTNWKKICLSKDNSNAIKTDGTLWVWGYRNFGAGGLLVANVCSPIQTIAGGSDWIEVAAAGRYFPVGATSAAAIREYCW